ncbi:MAG: ImmA/IrrE family metallo-endopeptidase [Actinobacteria bacterium]|nr:ImmA/IrrE family metallo-endopeptidase [Actinomycetota bacterium]
MAATSLSSKTKKLQNLVDVLRKAYPSVAFAAADTFYWAPEKSTVFYNPQSAQAHAHWSLLHELAHALLGHSDYASDLELLLMEMEAWEHAKILEQKHSSEDLIDDEHIQDCLDTYRDWLHARSSCPRCDQVGLQQDRVTYKCINCRQAWHISSARFKRPYRLCLDAKKETSPAAEADQVKFY